VAPYPQKRPVPVPEPLFDDFVQPRERSPFPTGAGEDSGPLPGATLVSPPPPLGGVQAEESRSRPADALVVTHGRPCPGA